MFERFSDRARRAVILAQQEALDLKHPYIGSEHILLGLMHEGDSIAADSLESFGISLDRVRDQVVEIVGEKKQLIDDVAKEAQKADSEQEELLDGFLEELLDSFLHQADGGSGESKQAPSGHLPFTARAKKALKLSLREALQLGHNYIGTEHILLALIREGDGVAAQVLVKLGVELARVRQQVIELLCGYSGTQGGASPITSRVLDGVGQNLTAAAMEGKLDPIIGRDKEIARVMEVLSRRTVTSPVLTGDPGLRKTTVVEGLAQAIVHGEVPATLKDKNVYALDLDSLTAGSQADFDERLAGVLEEIKIRGDIILFIDNLSALIGFGAPGGNTDPVLTLKSSVARGELQIIGATTLDEFRKLVQEEPALERRFLQIQVSEMAVKDAIELLRGLRDRYEAHHRVSITDSAFAAAVILSARHIDDRYLPQKAIDLIDEAGARMRITRMATPPDLREFDEKIADARREKEAAIDAQDFEKAANLRDKEKQLVAQRAVREKQWRSGDLDEVAEVDDEQIVEVIAEQTKIDRDELRAALPGATQPEALPETSASAEQRYLMLNDQPVSDDAEDMLGTAGIAKRLASIIEESRSAAPFVMAIDGGWGVGKSTLLTQIEARLPGKPEVIKLRFNAWTAEGENALESLIKSVLLGLDKRVVRRWARKLVKRRGMIAVARVGFGIAAGLMGVTRLVDDMWNRFEVDAQARNQLRESIQGMLTDWVERGGMAENRTLVVFIDDLDRCSDEVVVQVCEAVKLYLDAPGLVFVVACDLSVLARGVAGAARGGAGEGRTYLEKIIQVAYRVPAPSSNAVRQLIVGYGERSGISHLLDATVIDILSHATGRNPRRIKRIINSFVLEHHLDPAWRRAPLSSTLLITAILLQQLYPSFYSVVLDQSSGDDPVGDFLDYAAVRERAWNPPPADDAWWAAVRRTFQRRGLPAPKPLSVGSGEGLRVSDLEQSLPVDYPALARDAAFVALLKSVGRPNARKALRAHLLSSPLGSETLTNPPSSLLEKVRIPTVVADAKNEDLLK